MLRNSDFVARYGGEEFICILPDTNEEGAREIAERVMAKIAAMKIPHGQSEISPYITLSLGIATSSSVRILSPEFTISIGRWTFTDWAPLAKCREKTRLKIKLVKNRVPLRCASSNAALVRAELGDDERAMREMEAVARRAAVRTDWAAYFLFSHACVEKAFDSRSEGF